MAQTKRFVFAAVTGTSPVVVVRQESTGYVRDDDDGAFKAFASVGTTYLAATEDANLPGLFKVEISDVAWANGAYTAAIYADSTLATTIGALTLTLAGDVASSGVVIPAADTPYLCSRTAVKSALQIPTTNADMDSLVDAAIVAASDWIERFCRQSFAETTYTLYFSPGYDKTAVLKGATVLVFPFTLSSITTVHEDADRVYGPDTLIAAADYYVKGNTLVLYGDGDTQSFANGERTVKVVAVGGYATIPGLLQQAATMLATWIYGAGDRMRSPVASESSGGHTVTYKDEDMPKPVAAMLKGGGFVRMAS